MDNLVNAIKRIVADMVGAVPQSRFATVTAFDPATHSVKLIIQPDGIKTSWTPMHAVAVGNGTGMVIPPHIGDQVTVIPKEGDSNNYVVSGRFFHDDAATPVSSVTGKALDSGEIGIFGSNGSFMHVTTDGTWNITGKTIFTGDAVIHAPSSVLLDAPSVTTTGNLTVGTGATGTFTAASGQTVTVQAGIIINIC
jgi:phage baseplate assembly protein gpV